MRERIGLAVKNAKSIAEVKEGVLLVLKELKNQGNRRIGYVSGLITSEGSENMAKNVQRLVKFTDFVRSQNNFPIFSPTDVVSDELFERLGLEEFQKTDWEKFWRDILGTEEKYVTDMFMTPRWEASRGASDEHAVAKEVGMQIHYLIEEI
jgi:hypothetical protein